MSTAVNEQLKQKTATFSAGISPLWIASGDMFTYHGEDGIIEYLIQQLPAIPRVFADFGSGDCIKSNCARLAVHENWRGVFVDMNSKQLALGKRFYKNHLGGEKQLQFVEAKITPDNCNTILEEAGITGDIGLLSVDIDGNDIWIWKAISCIRPEIVVIEAKVEFGLADRAVPYSDRNHASADRMYNGASVEAFRKAGKQKGYMLVGANRQGYNLFFVREPHSLPELTTAEILAADEIQQSFYEEEFFTAHTFTKGV